jgi:sugar-specific transcriptional regulator TrmB
MTTLTESTLIELGLNKNEAIVYLSLIKFHEANANQIIKDTKFHKNIVYDNLEKLIQKGLVTYIQKDTMRYYQIGTSESLIDMFKEEKEKLEKKEKLAEVVAKEIEKQKVLLPSIQDAKIFRGVSAIKTFYSMTLKKGDFYVFGVHLKSVEIMGELFWKSYNNKKLREKISAKLIFNESLRDFTKNIEDNYTQIKFFEKEFEPLTETHIQNNFVAIIVWSETPIIFYIEDQEVTNSYKVFFEKMWKVAKK